MKKNLPTSFLISIVCGYQRILQPFFRVLSITFFGYYSHCKHTPTCSRYAILQIRKHGTITGLKKGLIRVWNCR